MTRSWKRLKLELDRVLADFVPFHQLSDVLPAPRSSGEKLRHAVFNLVARPERLAVAMMGNIAVQMVRSGMELGLFSYLKDHPGATPTQIREALGLTEHAADVLLAGLGSLKLIRRIGPETYNDPYLERVLQPGFQDGFFRKWMEFNHHLVRPASDFLLESLKQGRAVGMRETFGDVESFYQAVSLDPERMKYFDAFMKAVTALNKDQVASMSAFSQFRKIIDVGGSTGSMAMAIANHHTNADITVMDFPKTVEIAAQNFAKTPHRERLHVIGGNLLQEELPRGFDCITLCHMFGVFSEGRNIAILQRAYDALEPGGACCVYTPVLLDDEDGPTSNGLFSSYFLFLANGHGRFYSPERVRGWMQMVGFRDLRTEPLPAYEAVFIGRK